MAERFDFEAWIRAIESKNVDALLEFFTDDVEVYSEDASEPLHGKVLLRQLAEKALPTIGRISVKPIHVVQRGDVVAALVEFSAEYSRDLDFPGWVHLALEGKRVNLRGAVFATLNEAGKIVTLYRIRDTWTAMQQLGLRPEEVERIRRPVLQQPPHA